MPITPRGLCHYREGSPVFVAQSVRRFVRPCRQPGSFVSVGASQTREKKQKRAPRGFRLKVETTAVWSRAARLLARAPVFGRTSTQSPVVAPSVVSPASVATVPSPRRLRSPTSARPNPPRRRSSSNRRPRPWRPARSCLPAGARRSSEIPVVVVDGIVLVAKLVGPATAASRRVVVASPVAVRADDRPSSLTPRSALLRGGGAGAARQARARHRRGRAAKRRRHCHGRRSDGMGLAGRRRGLAQPGSRGVVVGGARDATRFSRSGARRRVKRRSMGVPLLSQRVSPRPAWPIRRRARKRASDACRRSTAAAALPRAIVRVETNDSLRARSKTRKTRLSRKRSTRRDQKSDVVQPYHARRGVTARRLSSSHISCDLHALRDPLPEARVRRRNWSRRRSSPGSSSLGADGAWSMMDSMSVTSRVLSPPPTRSAACR